MARQASSPSLCASVRAVPWADEADEQLSRLDPSGCQLSADHSIFAAELTNEPGRHHPIFKAGLTESSLALILIGIFQDKKAPQSLCLYASSAMGR